MTDLEVGSIVYRKFYSRTDKVRILELSEKHHTDSSMYYRDMKVKICGMEKIRQYRIPFYIENNQVKRMVDGSHISQRTVMKDNTDLHFIH